MEFRGTTIVAVKKDGKTAIAGDGQVTMGESVVMKGNAVKVRRIFNDKVVIGFAGSVADAFSLEARFEGLLQKFSGNLMRSAVEIALGFRDDKYVRKLEAMMIVADKSQLLIISGTGEVIEPEYGVCAIGSGGNYAYAAGRALLDNTNLTAKEIATKSIEIAGDICVFTNHHITVEEV
ncbi:MAG: ATP-dependent protease subunit HslV [Clostridia bacterium]|nr:ATP-dependent protease subunit HslV [Clostridia bacterium]